jgi:hypothetical protein
MNASIAGASQPKKVYATPVLTFHGSAVAKTMGGPEGNTIETWTPIEALIWS